MNEENEMPTSEGYPLELDEPGAYAYMVFREAVGGQGPFGELPAWSGVTNEDRKGWAAVEEELMTGAANPANEQVDEVPAGDVSAAGLQGMPVDGWPTTPVAPVAEEAQA